jgi:hypothetical protein
MNVIFHTLARVATAAVLSTQLKEEADQFNNWFNHFGHWFHRGNSVAWLA